jgi:uncharacterized protein (TIGR02996 family)
MSDEDAFHAAIDAAPEDAAPRLVFADWLEERGDERAEGYRAMGRLGRVAEELMCGYWYWTHSGDTWDYHRIRTPSSLHTSWWDKVYDIGNRNGWTSRREADDAAALAFSRLPPDSRADLLSRCTTA